MIEMVTKCTIWKRERRKDPKFSVSSRKCLFQKRYYILIKSVENRKHRYLNTLVL